MRMIETHADLRSKMRDFHAHLYLQKWKMRKKERKKWTMLVSLSFERWAILGQNYKCFFLYSATLPGGRSSHRRGVLWRPGKSWQAASWSWSRECMKDYWNSRTQKVKKRWWTDMMIVTHNKLIAANLVSFDMWRMILRMRENEEADHEREKTRENDIFEMKCSFCNKTIENKIGL